MNTDRIRRAIKKSYAQARAIIAQARAYPSEFAIKVALESVKEIRKMNSDRMRALRTGKTV